MTFISDLVTAQRLRVVSDQPLADAVGATLGLRP
jgi:hypothetical protein